MVPNKGHKEQRRISFGKTGAVHTPWCLWGGHGKKGVCMVVTHTRQDVAAAQSLGRALSALSWREASQFRLAGGGGGGEQMGARGEAACAGSCP